jgi:hypothetical protein
MSTASWRNRAFGASLTLLVQLGFMLAVLLSPSYFYKPLNSLDHETILLLRPLPKPAPTTIDARGSEMRNGRIPAPIVPPVLPQSPTAPSLAPPSGIAGFGHALFGCAPERYADLTPDERAHCPKPGEGIAKNGDNDLLTEPRSHAKYQAMWEEQWIEDHWVPAPCLPSPAGIAQCLMEQSMAEHKRAQAAWAKIAEDQAAKLKANTGPAPPAILREQSAPKNDLSQ